VESEYALAHHYASAASRHRPFIETRARPGRSARPLGIRGSLCHDHARTIDGIFWGDNPIFSAYQKQLLGLVAKSRLPVIASSREWVVAGVLISYGPVYVEMFRSAAVYVDKILKGATPADLPIEQPTKFELAINLKTAKALGLTIPPSLLARADQVIE
jgi:putative ABC transport system substrate-binding protein